MKSQNFQAFLALTIVALAFSACGLSEEELAATGQPTSPPSLPGDG